MPANVTGATPFQAIKIHAMTVKIEHEDSAAIIRRPVVTQVHHSSRVRVAASHREVGGITFQLSPRIPVAFASCMGIGAGPMPMIRDRLDRIVRVRKSRLAKRPLVSSPLSDMPQVGQNAAGDKELPVLIEVNSPWIGAAFAENLEQVFSRMISPDAASELWTLTAGGARSAHVRMARYALPAVKPAVGSPGECA